MLSSQHHVKSHAKISLRSEKYWWFQLNHIDYYMDSHVANSQRLRNSACGTGYILREKVIKIKHFFVAIGTGNAPHYFFYDESDVSLITC